MNTLYVFLYLTGKDINIYYVAVPTFGCPLTGAVRQMAGIDPLTVFLAAFLGTLSEAAYSLAWPPAPEEDDGRTDLKVKLAVGAVGTAAVGGYLAATGGIPFGTVLPVFAAIEVAKGLPAAVKVADMEAAKWSEWFDVGLSGTLPKRKAVTTMFFGFTGVLEALGVGPWAFVPAAVVLGYALTRRLR